MQILGQWVHKPRASLKPSKDAEPDKEGSIGSRNSLTGLLMSRSEDAVAAQKAGSMPASPAPDIDSIDKNNPLAASDYVGDIFAYYQRVEPIFRTAPDYMKDQVRPASKAHFPRKS